MSTTSLRISALDCFKHSKLIRDGFSDFSAATTTDFPATRLVD